MKIHGFSPSEQEMTVMIDRIDKNRNGKIDFEEFLSMMVNITESSVDQGYNVSQAFQVFDKVKWNIHNAFQNVPSLSWRAINQNNSNGSNDQNGDGLITEEEIRETMMVLGEPLTQTELTQMVLEADLNGDGKIDFEEFSILMENTDLFKMKNN